MLSFDLETTGLDPVKDRITCAAVCDPDAGIERIFFFHLGDSAEEFMRLLDQADCLCAFNGAEFDLPFIHAQLGPPLSRVRAWRLKLHDVFVACKWGVGVTFTLQKLLDANGLPGKNGSGLDAVHLYVDEKWALLGEYCLNDTRVTHLVSSMDRIVLPRVGDFVFGRDGFSGK
jgi:hypothetical protein